MLAEQPALPHHKLVPFAQPPLADAAAEAAQVVDPVEGAHHKLCGRDLLPTASTLCGENPEGTKDYSRRAFVLVLIVFLDEKVTFLLLVFFTDTNAKLLC